MSVYDLKRSYMTEAGVLTVLKGIHFTIQAGDLSFIIGRSGSGKSTLLHLLGGLDRPTSGKIMFEGEDVSDMGESELARIRNRRIGFVFQFYHLLPELTVYENVLLPQLIAGKRDEKWVKEVLKRVKLLSRQDHYPAELSGGEQQRTAIARALVNRPSLVLCDEPTGNLDTETAESVISLLTDLNEKEGQAFLMVTHDEVLAWRYQNVFRLVDGVLLKENTQNINVEKMQQ
jgi:lipoprotein-releasing system ATP-binding protein